MKEKVVVIIGQHRSGTSVLSGCLKILGGYLGNDYELEKDTHNEKGYFECSWTDHVNNAILNKVGMEWNTIPRYKLNGEFKSIELPNNWYTHKKLNDLYKIVKTHILNDLENKPPGTFYTIKDPRISLILPFYIRVFKELGLDAKFIFSDREDGEMASSLIKRDNLNPRNLAHNPDDGSLDVLFYYHRYYAEKYFKRFSSIGDKNIIWTNTFKNILYKPLNFLEYIIEKFNLPNNINEETKKELIEFIDKKLKHNHSKTNVKVISTYFGHRRTDITYSGVGSGIVPKNSGVSSTIQFIKEIIENERVIDSGVFMDTLLVNHVVSENMPGAAEAQEFLNKIDGTPTRNGVIKVLNRSWSGGRGGSFGSFNHAYQEHKEDYEYWFFTEDNVVQTKPGYFKQSILQLKENKRVGFICGYRHTTLRNNSHEKPHCHGGCGATHISHLNKLNEANGSLTYYKDPMSGPMLANINDRAQFASHSWAWYRNFEEYGEVGFTYSFIEAGLLLQDIKFDGKLSCYYGECC